MSLTEWRQYGWLVEHEPSATEMGDLLRVVERDLADARVTALSSDTRLKLAYNAALQSAVAALAACGYRAVRESYHLRTIRSLALTIGAEPALVSRLDRFRRLRHTGDYERAGMTSEEDANSALETAEEIAARVRRWLRTKHSELLGQS
ncbi:MAG: HEPN domain-containing protein [candidate division WOR-3 bacterium]